jgi:N-acetylneuraminic acid mutarotase
MSYQLYFSAVLAIFICFATNCSAQEKSVGVAGFKQTQTYGKITEIGKLSEARAAHTATRLNDGKILIAGGMERNGVFFDDADIFDPKTNNFTQAKNKMSIKRVSHTATLLPDGKVLIVGGWSNRLPEASAEIYDPKTETFTPIGNTHRRRSGHSATLLDNGKVLIAGGFDGQERLSEAEVFDSQRNSFSLIGKMRNARSVHAATKLADGRIVLSGGEANRGQILSSAEIFDPKTNNFSLTKAMNVVRYKHDSILLKDGRVLVFGGSDNRDWNGQYKSAEIFDAATNEFTTAGEMNFARFKVEGTAVLLKDGKVFIGGGGVEAEVFNPLTNTFIKTTGEFGTPLHYATVTLLDDERALIVGGYGRGTRETGPISTNRAWIFKL